jgi:hypothetical protein
VKCYGCLFHFGQAIYRKLQQLGLSKIYNDDYNVKNIIRMMLNICFIPIKSIVVEFEKIKKIIESKNFDTKIIEFVKYFEDCFVGKFDDQKSWISPRFKHDFWSVNSRVLSGLPRTTNGVESWHRSLNMRILTAHPNLGKFITLIQSEEEVVRVSVAKAKSGSVLLPRKDFKFEDRLRIIVSNFDNFFEMKFYEAIGLIYSWKFEDEID